MTELYKDIEDFEGVYEVSNIGNIRRVGKDLPLKPLPLKNKYMRVDLSKNGIAIHKSVHRLVAQAFIANPLNLSSVNHKDLDKSNNSVDNLEWCSCKQNSEHASNNDRFLSEEEHHSNILTRKEVLDLVTISKSGMSSRAVGRLFGVSKTTVLNILNHKRWVKFLDRSSLLVNTEITNKNNILLAS